MAALNGHVPSLRNSGFFEVVSLALPAGSYALVGKGHISGDSDDLGASCDLVNGNQIVDRASEFVPVDFAIASFSVLGLVSLPSGGTIRIECSTSHNGIEAFDAKMLATAVTPI